MRALIKLLVVAVVCCGTPASIAAAESRDEVEARFLVTFFKFIRWPRTSDTASICFLGNSSVRDSILDAIRHDAPWSRLKDRTIVTKVLTGSEITDDCNILWIDAQTVAQLWDGLTMPVGVFTVSDSRDFARRGGMFEFHWSADNSYRLAINVANVVRSGLVVSGALGTLADRVDNDRGQL